MKWSIVAEMMLISLGMRGYQASHMCQMIKNNNVQCTQSVQPWLHCIREYLGETLHLLLIRDQMIVKSQDYIIEYFVFKESYKSYIHVCSITVYTQVFSYCTPSFNCTTVWQLHWLNQSRKMCSKWHSTSSLTLYRVPHQSYRK